MGKVRKKYYRICPKCGYRGESSEFRVEVEIVREEKKLSRRHLVRVKESSEYLREYYPIGGYMILTDLTLKSSYGHAVKFEILKTFYVPSGTPPPCRRPTFDLQRLLDWIEKYKVEKKR